MKFTIDWQTWRCGRASANSLGRGLTLLLNSDGFMCCLGHVSLSLGFTREQMLGLALPCCLNCETILSEKLAGVSLFDETPLAQDAIRINDNRDTTPYEKMELLKALFSKHGHEIEFVNVPERA